MQARIFECDGKEKDEWDLSVSEYSAFASENKLYRETAEALVNEAEIRPGMVIVDLACGTGMVTEAILKTAKLDDVKVIAIDSSSGMLDEARRRIRRRNVEFMCDKAETFSGSLKEKVDRVLCNAAFWLFDKEKMLSQVSQSLKPSGKCLIGIPSMDFRHIDFEQLYWNDRVSWMILEEILARGYGSNAREETIEKPPPVLSETGHSKMLNRYRLIVSKVRKFILEIPQREFIEFLRIPVMARYSFFAGRVPEVELIEILDTVSRQLEWVNSPPSRKTWEIYEIEADGLPPD